MSVPLVLNGSHSDPGRQQHQQSTDADGIFYACCEKELFKESGDANFWGRWCTYNVTSSDLTPLLSAGRPSHDLDKYVQCLIGYPGVNKCCARLVDR